MITIMLVLTGAIVTVNFSQGQGVSGQRQFDTSGQSAYYPLQQKTAITPIESSR